MTKLHFLYADFFRRAKRIPRSIFFKYFLLIALAVWILFMFLRSGLYIYRIAREEINAHYHKPALFSSFKSQPLEKKYLKNYKNLNLICTKL